MRRVLLVEDEGVIRSGLKKMIEQVIGGYVICGEAAGGDEALSILEKSLPDVIVTDIKMENGDGLDMIRQIRLLHEAIPIVIISGYANFRFAREALKSGVSDYLLKPVDRIELMQALSKACGVRKNEVSHESQLIQQVKEIIDKQLGEEISLRSIADEVGINHQYLSALFKNQTGQNFLKYVTDHRMRQATHLLKESNLKIYEIAMISGYRSIKHFTSVFREYTGTTPTEYRNS